MQKLFQSYNKKRLGLSRWGNFGRNACVLVLVSLLCSFLSLPAFADSEQGAGLGYFPRTGMSVKNDMTLSGVDPGSPAEKVGLRIGDRIANIEGHEVGSLSRSERFKLLSGETGTVCHLYILRGGNQYSVAITRGQFASVASDRAAGGVSPASASSGNSSSSSSSSNQDTNLEKDLLTIDGHTSNTDAVHEKVSIALRMLPSSVKQALIASGITIVITSSRANFDDGPEGKCCFEPRFKRVLIVEQGALTAANMQRMPITVLHEIGHAYDFMQGYVTKQSEFLSLYEEDSQRISGALADRLSYFLQAGHRGPSECFASLFARKYYAGPDKRLQDLEASFPNTLRLVRSLQP